MTGRARDGLVERIRQRIAELQLTAGERLGTERALAEELGVPRSALRTALEELEAAGGIRRTMGRLGGVFVSDGKIERHLNTIEGVPDLLRRQGVRPGTEVLRAELSTASPAETRALRLAAHAPVLRLVRRRDADGIPLSLDSMTLPTRRFPGISSRDLSSGIYRLMQEDYGITLSHADETIDVVEASRAQAEVLAVAPLDPLLHVRRLTFDSDGHPVEFSRDLFRADRTRITLQRYGVRWKRAAPEH